MKKGKKKSYNKDKAIKMIVDILEDIVGLNTVYNSEIGRKVMNLSTYIEFGKELEELQ